MKFIARVCFRFQNMKGAEAAEEDLRAAGYETDNVIRPIGNLIWIEILKDLALAADADTISWVVFALMSDVNSIVNSYGGECAETHQVPDDYKSHSKSEFPAVDLDRTAD